MVGQPSGSINDNKNINFANKHKMTLYHINNRLFKTLKKKIKIPEYLKELIYNYPKITSGRKNFSYHHERILKTLNLIKKTN